MNLCDECGMKHATVHVTHIDGETTVVSHLCDECAKKKGISISIALGEAPSEERQAPLSDAGPETAVCGGCAMPFSEFKAHGRLGCERCYGSFEKDIDALLKQVHGAAVHKGKPCPKKFPVSTEVKDIKRLRAELRDAVHNEEFERAAALRDAINALCGKDSLQAQSGSCAR